MLPHKLHSAFHLFSELGAKCMLLLFISVQKPNVKTSFFSFFLQSGRGDTYSSLSYFNPLFNPYANLGQSETDFEIGCIKKLAAQYLFGFENLSLLAAEKDN